MKTFLIILLLVQDADYQECINYKDLGFQNFESCREATYEDPLLRNYHICDDFPDFGYTSREGKCIKFQKFFCFIFREKLKLLIIFNIDQIIYIFIVIIYY